MLETSQSNGGVVYVGNQLTNGGVVYVTNQLTNGGVVYFGDQSVKRWRGLCWKPVRQTVAWSVSETSQSNGGVVYFGDQSVKR